MQTKSKLFLTALIAASASIVLVSGALAGEVKGSEMAKSMVKAGSKVTLHYTLTVEGKVVDSSRERTPLQFQAGQGQLIPGFEKALIGMKAGEKKSFKVSPEDGYGPVDPKALKEIPKDRLAPDVKPEAGMMLSAQGPNGQTIPVKVAAVKDKTVVIDFNHPLAGKTLNFDVEIVEVR